MKTNPLPVIPVILAGGQGTRLWPASLPNIPKQFITIEDQSLMFRAIERAKNINSDEIIVLTGAQYVPLFSQQLLPELKLANISPQTVTLIGEPVARNTAPAIALATKYVIEKYTNAILLVITADHLITPIEVFEDDVKNAVELATINVNESQGGNIVTFGIFPTYPETGYGYIELGESVGKGNKVHAFKEKPSEELAKEYLKTNNFLWNSGMFCFPAKLMAKEMSKYCPVLFDKIIKQDNDFSWNITQEQDFPVIIPNAVEFESLEKISIDYAIMEKSQQVMVVKANFDWNDIGSWDEAALLLENSQENSQKCYFESANNNVIYSDLPIGICGVSDIIVVVKNNRVLILKKGCGQGVSSIAKEDKY